VQGLNAVFKLSTPILSPHFWHVVLAMNIAGAFVNTVAAVSTVASVSRRPTGTPAVVVAPVAGIVIAAVGYNVVISVLYMVEYFVFEYVNSRIFPFLLFIVAANVWSLFP
jgi:hypothetical protein